MVQRRFGPLIALVVLGAIVLSARLFQVQVLQHTIWSAEAENLVRSGAIVPYKRGSIRDANGFELAHDREAWGIEFCYRDFRRAHPLAQVVHALSSLFARTATFAETLPVLQRDGRELAMLSPKALNDFARGKGLVGPGELHVAPSEDAEFDQTASRAADLRFYVEELLDFSKDERRELLAALADKREVASYAEFVAERRHSSREVVLAELDRKLTDSVDDLAELARELAESGAIQIASKDANAPFAELVARIESWRARVEDDAASELFRQAAHFGPGRIRAETATSALDFAWLARVLRWEPPRVAEWLARARKDWQQSIAEWTVPSILAEMQLTPADDRRAESLIGELTANFVDAETWARARVRADRDDEPLAWREFDSLAVLDRIDVLLRAKGDDAARASRNELFAFQDPALRSARFENRWECVARLELKTLGVNDEFETKAKALAAEWKENAEEHFRAEWIEKHVVPIFARWEDALQDEIARELAALSASAPPKAKGAEGRLLFADELISLAGEQVAYVIKDRGNRPIAIDDHPPYALVQTVSRYRDRLAGFSVRARQDRVREVDPKSARVPAEALIGNVAQPDMLELKRQRHEARELASLSRIGRKSGAESARFFELLARVDRPGEKRGSDGIEGYFDPELTGRNGYRVVRGLEEIAERDQGRTDSDLEVRDGQSIELTIDDNLQRAAEECLAHPDGDPSSGSDGAWNANPVGAIVLCTVDGDVLAAASVPLEPRGEKESRNQRDWAVDRTLRIFDFQPPGSVFKPFVTCFALENLGLDPNQTVLCARQANGEPANYKGLHCSHPDGHGTVDLSSALKLSCNCYFATVGEKFDAPHAIECMKIWGFGAPTGVQSFGRRSGLREDAWPQASKLAFHDLRQRLSFANGLSVVQATPMQVARAYAGLASGALPEMRLVGKVGDREVEKRATSLPFKKETLDFVRRALLRVTGEVDGTGHKALNPTALGFEFAAKTGSGDYRPPPKGESADGENRVRKHTWVGGWFPAEDPRYVLVVFEFDTIATSSHGAIWLAAQFLRRPELREYVDAHRENR